MAQRGEVPGDARLLHGLNRYGAYSLALAFVIIVLASAALSYRLTGVISVAGMLEAQRETLALQVLDFTAVLLALWGQYAGSIIARRARALLDQQSDDLLAQTSTWQRKALHESTHDPLTGLPNRALFYEKTMEAMREANRSQRRFAMLLVDLDGFKEINDAFGPGVGDQILNLAAVRLRQMLPQTDVVGRLDGDEFALLLLNLPTPDVAVGVAGRVRSAIETPFILDGNRIEISASVGISLYPEHGAEAAVLLGRAEAAMFASKRVYEGFVVFSESQVGDAVLRPMLTADLRHAMESGQLELYYQPQVHMEQGALPSVEALIRWLHPQHGSIPPQEFIPLAERTRIIRPLTNWVLTAAVEQMARWRAQGIHLGVSVNISGGDLIDPALCGVISSLLSAHRIEPGWLALEITEGSAMSDNGTTLKVLRLLNRIGVRLSIDDFGTGYSSLSYLSRLPVQELKIDKSFVLGMLENRGDRVIVETTIGLAHNLGLEVVAEGVENAAIWERLRALHCDLAQGYYLSRPLPAAEFVEWMQGARLQPAPLRLAPAHAGAADPGTPLAADPVWAPGN